MPPADRYAAPAHGRARWIDAGGLRVHAVTWQGGGDGAGPQPPPALLLHGLGGSTVYWELVGPRLAASLATRVTAVDLAGFGRTRAEPRAAELSANARLVASILEREGPAVLVGHSMGGSLAVQVAAKRGALVRGLVLVTPALPQIEASGLPQPLFARNLLATLPELGPFLVGLYRILLTPTQLVDDRLRAGTLRPDRVDPEIRRRLVELAALRRGFGEGAGAYAAAARTLLGYLASPLGMRDDARAVRCPALLVHGEHDRLVPLALARSVHERHPAWQLAVLSACAHIPQIERPAALVEAIERWWDSEL